MSFCSWGFDDQGVVLTMRRFSRRRLLAARKWFAKNGRTIIKSIVLTKNPKTVVIKLSQ
jgi:hypothetical protein